MESCCQLCAHLAVILNTSASSTCHELLLSNSWTLIRSLLGRCHHVLSSFVPALCSPLALSFPGPRRAVALLCRQSFVRSPLHTRSSNLILVYLAFAQNLHRIISRVNGLARHVFSRSLSLPKTAFDLLRPPYSEPGSQEVNVFLIVFNLQKIVSKGFLNVRPIPSLGQRSRDSSRLNKGSLERSEKLPLRLCVIIASSGLSSHCDVNLSARKK